MPILNPRNDIIALASLAERDVIWVDKLPGVTGAGTSGNPWVGWEGWAANISERAVLYFRAGFFYTPTECRFVNRFVSARGAGGWATVVRGGDAGAGKAVLRWSVPTNEENKHIRIEGICLDGNGVTPIGLYLRDVSYSSFRDIRFINCADCGIVTTRGISNNWENIYSYGDFHGQGINDPDHWHTTPNGMRISDPAGDPINTGDRAVTCSNFIGLEFRFLPGTAIYVDTLFSCQFIGGAAEVCGVGIEMGPLCNRFDFIGMNFEYCGVHPDDATPERPATPGMVIRGSRHRFSRNVCIHTTARVEGDGLNAFEHVQVDAVEDNCVGPNEYLGENANTIGAVTGTNNHVYWRFGQHTEVRKRGSMLKTLKSEQAGVAAGINLPTVGLRDNYVASYPSGKLYLISTGGMADWTSEAEAATQYALRVDSSGSIEVRANITAGGTITAVGTLAGGVANFTSSINLTTLGVDAIARVKCNDAGTSGKGAGVELFCAGAVVANIHLVPAPHRLYFSVNGGINPTNAVLDASTAMYLTDAGDLTVKGKMEVRNKEFRLGNGILFEEGGALKWWPDGGNIHTLATFP
jgi:hypothetical protein